jgi:hypothetical protein
LMRRINQQQLVVLLVVLLFGPVAIVQAQSGGNSAIDLAGCKWSTSAGARATIQGNEIDLEVGSLPQSAPRTMECWVSLPGDQRMVVQGLHHGAVTELGWTFAFERSTGERRQLYQGSQERQFTFPAPAEWERDKRIGIVIGIPGDNPGYLHLQDLRVEAASSLVLPSPDPISPTEEQEVTPPAADFLWSCPEPGQVVGYTLEWQREGEEAQRTHITEYFRSDARGLWPPEWLSTGKYSWRVRAWSAAGLAGPWSNLMHFSVRAEDAPRPPHITPSAKRPLTILNLPGGEVSAAWGLVPADLRPTFLFRDGGPRPYVAGMLAAAQAAGAPIALQVNGPHNIIAGRWDRLPLSLLEQWAHQYSDLRAFYICEQQVQGGMENPDVTGYLERLIALGQETGRPVFWADANWGRNIWLDVEAHTDFTRFLKAHYGYVCPLWKMNGGDAPYLAPAGLLGLWLNRTVAAWGVQPEDYYWTEAGFTTLGTQLGYKEGVRQDAPPVIYQDLALLGASAGAEVYSFEPTGDFLAPAASHPGLDNIFWPLFRMLRVSVIPDLPAVHAATVMTRVLDPADLAFRVDYTKPMRQLFRKTLGIGYPSQMVPESGSCYWIPFLPAEVGAAGQPAGAEHPETGTAKSCPPPDPTKAAVFRTGQATFVFNSRVNWPGEQAFSLQLIGTEANGRLGTNGWVTIRPDGADRAHLWFFARKGSRLTMDFNRPVIWRKASSDVRSADSGRAGQGASAPAHAWSSPVSSLDLTADQHPWNVEIREEREGSSP